MIYDKKNIVKFVYLTKKLLPIKHNIFMDVNIFKLYFIYLKYNFTKRLKIKYE